jgi:hypothetical protein
MGSRYIFHYRVQVGLMEELILELVLVLQRIQWYRAFLSHQRLTLLH